MEQFKYFDSIYEKGLSAIRHINDQQLEITKDLQKLVDKTSLEKKNVIHHYYHFPASFWIPIIIAEIFLLFFIWYLFL